MIATLLILVIGAVLGDGLGYAIHRWIHSPKSGKLYNSHMTHHKKLYPITNFYSVKYRNPGNDNTVFSFAKFFIAITILMFLLLPHKIALIFAIEFIVVGVINDYFHTQVHLKRTRWDNYKWFQKLEQRHWQHHKDMGKNYGVVTFVWDRLFRTLK